jgi:integrase
MINRDNWKLLKAYLKHRLEIDRLVPGSMGMERTCLNHLLEWLDDKPVWVAPKITPNFLDYLKGHKGDGYSSVYSRKVIETAHRFFQWLVKYYPHYEKNISVAWLDTLKPIRSQNDDNEHEFVTLDEIRAISQAPVETIRDRRVRAAVVFLFLSGMRGGAFVTLPIKAIDIKKHLVFQWPSLGVHTKFSKKGTTHILDIPDLLEVIKAWDDEVRTHLPDTSYWFATLSPETGYFDPAITQAGNYRVSRLNKDLRDWLSRVGLPYHSSHKFRHGHAVHGLQNSHDIADLKAVSQNLMHSNLSITDGVYGMLSVDDVGKRIANLGQDTTNTDFSLSELSNQLNRIETLLKK